MNDEKKREEIALFRYGVIADFFTRQFLPREKASLLKEKASKHYSIPYSERTEIAIPTIKEWLTLYRQGGFEALKPRARSDQGKSRSLPHELANLIITLKEENPSRSVSTILRELKLSGNLSQKISTSTVYRFLESHGLIQKESPSQDRRHFEFAYPGELIQSDCLHGPRLIDPSTGKKKKTYLFAFLDDCTRVIYHAQFYFDEGLLSFEHAFKQALLKRGIPKRFFCDNGAVYRSHHVQVVCASLGIILIHSRVQYPEGRGKIERFFRTLSMQFLAQLDLDKIKGLEDLNSRLWAWVEGEYHRTIHSSLKETPMDKWMRLSEHVRYVTPQIDLDEIFLHRVKRRIYSDRTFSLDGILYEATPHLVGKQVEIRFNPKDKSQVKVYFEGRMEQIATPVTAYENCFVKRNKKTEEILSSTTPLKVKKSGINYVELIHKEYYQGEPWANKEKEDEENV